jgi:hypothetical protein
MGHIVKVHFAYISKCISNFLLKNYLSIFLDTDLVNNR